MKTFTQQWSSASGWGAREFGAPPVVLPQLLLAFWNSKSDPQAALDDLSSEFPDATLVGCSTAGSIAGATVTDTDFLVTGIEFAQAEVRAVSAPVATPEKSKTAGMVLGRELLADGPEPRFVLVISDGLAVNGSDLVAGLRAQIHDAPISGGLAGDGPDFVKTQVSLGSRLQTGSVIAIGVWGQNITVNHGSAGGWEPFGPAREITKSTGSTLFELDHQPALDLYRMYLGDEAENLPGSALHFPLAITNPKGHQQLVRTVLAMDVDERSLRFAGDIPLGWGAQLMRTTFDRLVEGAQIAAESSLIPTQRAGSEPLLAIAVSCVGRRLVLGQRADEEVEACMEILGEHTTLSGFYSYGEIAPVDGFVGLHNQTMTLTTVAEIPPSGPTSDIAAP